MNNTEYCHLVALAIFFLASTKVIPDPTSFVMLILTGPGCGAIMCVLPKLVSERMLAPCDSNIDTGMVPQHAAYIASVTTCYDGRGTAEQHMVRLCLFPTGRRVELVKSSEHTHRHPTCSTEDVPPARFCPNTNCKSVLYMMGDRVLTILTICRKRATVQQ